VIRIQKVIFLMHVFSFTESRSVLAETKIWLIGLLLFLIRKKIHIERYTPVKCIFITAFICYESFIISNKTERYSPKYNIP